VFLPLAKLRFGDPIVGTLSNSGHLADRLARAALERWPEAGPFPRGNPQRRISKAARRVRGNDVLRGTVLHARAPGGCVPGGSSTNLGRDSVPGDRDWSRLCREIFSWNRLMVMQSVGSYCRCRTNSEAVQSGPTEDAKF
jgi:hypothetical protein